MLFNPNWKPHQDTIDKVGELMLKAADYLETHRWAQGEFIAGNGAVCLVGSLIRTEVGKVSNDINLDEIDHPVSYLAYKRISTYLKIVPETWNDDDDRKKAEVIEALREAAKLK